jgi:hypothetical protein
VVTDVLRDPHDLPDRVNDALELSVVPALEPIEARSTGTIQSVAPSNGTAQWPLAKLP